MPNLQAFFVVTLLTWAAVSVSGTTPELSTTTGDTVNIPCDFGEGTLRNIFWYYNDGTGPQKILVLSRGELVIEAEYAIRAGLQSDNSTLILKDITVADEGTYRCDVDRQGQTAVPNINTKLNVFSLRPDTLPMIPPCTGADESSSCSIHANQSFTLTCTLPNVYPVEDTELMLQWYQDGKRVSSTDDVTQNDDGTTNIRRQIQISETGNFTCNATYHSANGRENTAVSVEAWIILSLDVPNTPGKKWTKSKIGTTIGVLLAIIVITLVLVIIFFYRRSKKPADNSASLQSSSVTQGGSSNRIVSEKEFLELSKQIEPSYYKEVGINLDMPAAELGQIKESSQNTNDALMTVFTRWRDKQLPGKDIRALLAEALEVSDLGSLAGSLVSNRTGITVQYKSCKDSSATHISAGEGDRPTPQNSSAKSQQDQDQPSSREDTRNKAKTQHKPEELKLLGASAENGSKDGNASVESSQRNERVAENSSKNEEGETISRSTKRDQPSSRKDKKKKEKTQHKPEELELLGASAENGSKDGNASVESSKPCERPAENCSNKEDVRTGPTEEPDFDTRLIGLAKKIPDDNMNELGKKLGFDAVEIDKYVATNSRYQKVTSNGTLTMLRDWDKNQTKATEREALKQALFDAGLVRLADDFFS